MKVTVSDASGKVAFKGATTANATFATASLKPGNYMVQFHSKSEAVKGKHYLLVVSAGTKKVMADAVAGERLTGNGVAMKVTVGPGLNITGQLVPDRAVASSQTQKIKVIDGKRYVWVKARTGSNLPDHWEAEGLAEGRIVGTLSTEKLRQFQDRSFEGSMLNRHPGHVHDVTHGHGF